MKLLNKQSLFLLPHYKNFGPKNMAQLLHYIL
jgi:hypothetical protein